MFNHASILTADPHAADFPNRLERLLRRLAPNDPPIPVVFQSHLPHDFSGTDGSAGCMLWPGLTSDGPAAFIHDQVVAREVEQHAERARRVGMPVNIQERLASRLLGVALHEAAHALEREWLVRDQRDDWEPTIADLRRYTAKPTSGPTAPVPWHQHEWEFIRAAAHLVYRASRLGLEIDLGTIVYTRDFGLSWYRRYYETLRPELRRMRNKTFAEIRATPPPPALLSLWQADMHSWAEHQARYPKQPSVVRPTVADDPPSVLQRNVDMVNLLEAIKDRVSHRKRTRLADYAALVRRLVDDGQAVDPDEAARILDESDHDADQLAGDVETARQRKAWRQKIDALPGLEREESEVRAKAEAENAKLRAAEKKHTEAVWPLDNRLIEIGKARAEAQAAKADLIRTASDALKRQAAEVQSEAGEVERQKAELRNAIHEHEDFVLQFGKQEAVNHIHPGDLSELQRVRAKLLELRAKLAALDGDTAKLAKQSAEIAEQMLCL